MINKLCLSAAAIILLCCPSALRAQPEVGDIFDTDFGEKFRGWDLITSGMGVDDTFYSIFQMDDSYLLTLNAPVVRTAAGGVSVNKITHRTTLRAAPGEEMVDGHDCTFAGVAPAIAFYSKTTGIARGFFVFKDEIRPKKWFPDEAEPCQYSGD